MSDFERDAAETEARIKGLFRLIVGWIVFLIVGGTVLLGVIVYAAWRLL